MCSDKKKVAYVWNENYDSLEPVSEHDHVVG